MMKIRFRLKWALVIHAPPFREPWEPPHPPTGSLGPFLGSLVGLPLPPTSPSYPRVHSSMCAYVCGGWLWVWGAGRSGAPLSQQTIVFLCFSCFSLIKSREKHCVSLFFLLLKKFKKKHSISLFSLFFNGFGIYGKAIGVAP